MPKTLSDPPLRTCDTLQLESKFARQQPRLTERIVPSLAYSKGLDTLCRPPFLRQRKVAVEHHKCSISLFEGTTKNNGKDPLFPLCRSDRLLCVGISRSGIARTSHLIKYPTATPLHLENHPYRVLSFLLCGRSLTSRVILNPHIPMEAYRSTKATQTYNHSRSLTPFKPSIVLHRALTTANGKISLNLDGMIRRHASNQSGLREG